MFDFRGGLSPEGGGDGCRSKDVSSREEGSDSGGSGGTTGLKRDSKKQSKEGQKERRFFMRRGEGDCHCEVMTVRPKVCGLGGCPDHKGGAPRVRGAKLCFEGMVSGKS